MSSNLVEHAKRELKLLGNDDEFNEHIIKAVEAFSEYGHSGFSAAYSANVIHQLLQFKNVMPLTDDPDEWFFHGDDMSGSGNSLWQNKRSSDCFSEDGGKTYYSVNDKDREMKKSLDHKISARIASTQTDMFSKGEN